MKKLLAILLSLAMMLGICSAAFAAEDDLSGHIVYWSIWNETENNAQWMKQAMDSFTALHPNVTFECVWTGRTNAAAVNSALASGEHIDMWDGNSQVNYTLNNEYAISVADYYNAVYPTTDGKAYRDCVLPSMTAMAEGFTGGTDIKEFIYHPTAYLFFYNKEVFADCGIEKTPDTWEEFLETCQILKDHGYIPIATDNEYACRILGVYLTYKMGNDYVEELVNSGVGEKWADQPVVDAVKELESLVQKGYYKPGQASTPWPAVQQEMVIEGNIAMYYNGTWLPNEVIESSGPDFPWGEFAFPALADAAIDQTWGGYASMGLMISDKCECPDAAAAFAAYLTTSEYDDLYVTMCNGIPVKIGGTWPEALKDAESVIGSYQHWFLSGSMIESNSELLPTLWDCMVRLLSGTMTADEMIATMSGK